MTDQPNFLVIGAMKAGTTSLHSYLGRHPDIHVTSPKELHFFNTENYKNESKLKEYFSYFKSSKLIAGSSPQSYSKCHNKYYQNIPERIHEVLPNVKLVYILRDPIDRYKSHLLENYYGEPRHDVKYNIETDHYMKTGLYYFQLQAYLKYFKLDQIHILTLEDLTRNRLETLNKLFTFLGVCKMNNDTVFDFISNKKEDKKLPYVIKQSLIIKILNKLLPSLVERVSNNNKIKEYFLDRGSKKLLSNIDEEDLVSVYKEDCEKLRALTGLSFEKWSV